MSIDNITNHRHYLNLKRYRYLLYEIIKKNIKLKYRRSNLGIFWTFFNPLLFTIVLTLVFSNLYSRSIENFALYVVIGKLIFDLFASSVRSGLLSFGSAGEIKKIYIPKYIYPLAGSLSAFVTFWISMLVLVLMVIVTGVTLRWFALFAIVPILLLFALAFGVGLTLSVINVFFRDMQQIWGVITQILMWTSAIFYPARIIPAKYQFILTYNPVFIAIDSCRNSIMYNQPTNPMSLLYIAVLAVIFIILGIILLYKYQDKFILHL
ncbi:ABC transporter permease [Methanobrevibacter filiformis]|uniref:Polysialic acid transport protein KpsM n=1 Tax=Methanobrevibacter filiformis TaxID=55758 RepID=A0A166FD77_9EURY|nr:ABC transporter permease [Methanobrevibacter filiformis]KZX17556.1 polysialic acid transport protein KpsM [Methanobrevibacter filiformis]